MKVLKATLVLLALLATTSCATVDQSIVSIADVMNERGWSSCFKWEAFLKAMDISGGKVEGVTVTGGAELEKCIELWKAQM